MAHNCWFVEFRSLQVSCLTYRWSAGHGDCSRDRRSHPEGGCAYGSGAAGRAGPVGTISGVRWDDARYDSKVGAEGAQPRGVSTLDCESRRLHHSARPRQPDGKFKDAFNADGEGTVSGCIIGKPAGDAQSCAAAVSGREYCAVLPREGERHNFRPVRSARPRVHQGPSLLGRTVHGICATASASFSGSTRSSTSPRTMHRSASGKTLRQK